MAQTLYIDIDAVDDVLRDWGTGARLEVQRSEDDTFAAPTSLANVSLVAGQNTYEVFDATGDPGDWYRHRVTTSTGTVPSAWVIRQAGALTAYATVDALRELLHLPDDSRDNLLADLLRRVTDKINLTLGFDFFRHPQVTGTEVRLYDGDGTGTVTVTQGIYSLTTVRLATATGAAYESLATTDWALRWPVAEGGPYLALQLTGVGSYPTWYTGFDTVELTGVFGYPSVPPAIEQATLMWAADLYRLGSGGGSPLSATGEEFGGDRFAGGMPRFAWETIEEYRSRHQTWLVV